MLGLHARVQRVKYEAPPAGIDAVRQMGVAQQTGQRASIPALNGEALRALW